MDASDREAHLVARGLDAVIVLGVAARFQAFCRDLHSEATAAVIESAPVVYRPALRRAFSVRNIDRENAWPKTLGKDFAMFDFDLWEETTAFDAQTPRRLTSLEQLYECRNNTAHDDLAGTSGPDATGVTLEGAHRWREDCGDLARCLDEVVANRVERMVGVRPW